MRVNYLCAALQGRTIIPTDVGFFKVNLFSFGKVLGVSTDFRVINSPSVFRTSRT